MFKVSYQGTQSIDNKYIDLTIKYPNGTSGRGYKMTDLSNYQTATFETAYGFDFEAVFENLTKAEKLFVDETDDIILLDIVVTDTAISFVRVDPDASVQITPAGSGYTIAYKVLGGGMVHDDNVVAAGNYTAVLTKTVMIDDKKTLEIVEKPFTVIAGDENPIVITETATKTKPVSLKTGAISIQNDQIEYMGEYISNTEDFTQIITNADFNNITRRIKSFDETKFCDMKLPNLSVDLTTLSASVINPDLYFHLKIGELLTIKDEQIGRAHV